MLAGVALLAACDGGGEAAPLAPPEPAPPPEETAVGRRYLASIGRIFDGFAADTGIIEFSGPTAAESRAAFFRRLRDRERGRRFASALSELEARDPPPAFAADHETLLDWLQTLNAEDARIGSAVRDDDLAALLVARVAITKATLASGLELSPSVCETRAVAFGCTVDGETPGEAYGATLQTIWRRLLIDIAAAALPGSEPRLASLATAEEQLELIATLFGEAVGAYDQSMDALARFDAPQEFAADHRRFLAMLTEQRDLLDQELQQALAGAPSDPAPLFRALRAGGCAFAATASADFLRIVDFSPAPGFPAVFGSCDG